MYVGTYYIYLCVTRLQDLILGVLSLFYTVLVCTEGDRRNTIAAFRDDIVGRCCMYR